MATPVIHQRTAPAATHAVAEERPRSEKIMEKLLERRAYFYALLTSLRSLAVAPREEAVVEEAAGGAKHVGGVAGRHDMT